MRSITLLLTATIDSSNISFMLRSETNDRLNDYVCAINKWTVFNDLKIVLVENSNFPWEMLKSRLERTDNIEYLSFNGQNFPRHRGKGYGEICSLEFAFNKSKQLKNSDVIVKCNGRYFFKDFMKLGLVNSDITGNFSRDLTTMDSRVFAAEPNFFRYILKYKENIDDSNGIFFEHILSMAVHEYLIDGGRWSRLPFPLIIDGISGTENRRYNTLFSVCKIKVKYWLNSLFHLFNLEF